MAKSFESLNIMFPQVMAWVVAIIEAVGGALLVVGLLSRFWGLLLTGVMVGAYMTAHYYAIEAMMKYDFSVFVSETPFQYMMMSLIVLIFGPGKWSLDYLWLKKEA